MNNTRKLATRKFAIWDGPLGQMIVAATAQGICGVWFADQKYVPDTRHWVLDGAEPLLAQAKCELDEYFKGHRTTFGFPLDLTAGTAFQQSVWRALQGIPVARTMTYGELARHLGKPTSIRATAGAIGRNPLSIVIPCHRVIGSNGTLTGYAGGVVRKAALLAHENSGRTMHHASAT